MAIEEDVIAPEDEEEEEESGTEDESGEGNKGKDGDGKQRREPESPEARKARLDREIARHQKQHPDLYKKQDAQPEGTSADGMESKTDYGQLAFLAANDLKADDEQALALRIAAETAKELKDVVNGAYFKAELKALREENAAKDALPGSKRSKASSPSSLEYWLEKGGLPPDNAANRELRTKIVNARMDKERKGSQFTDHPVAGRA